MLNANLNVALVEPKFTQINSINKLTFKILNSQVALSLVVFSVGLCSLCTPNFVSTELATTFICAGSSGMIAAGIVRLIVSIFRKITN